MARDLGLGYRPRVPLAPDLVPVLEAFGLPAAGAHAAPATTGLISRTELVTLGDGRELVVQRLARIFGPDVVDDIDRVCAHVEAHGLACPRPLPRPDGSLTWTDGDGGVWRALRKLDGITIERVTSPAIAREAGALVARWHAALADYAQPFSSTRAPHDTARHRSRLVTALAAARPGDTPSYATLVPMGETIARALEDAPTFADAPRRVTHGDLKISNLLFAPDGTALALIDLDTLGRQPLAHELGDAWRSWVNPRGEDVVDTVLDLDVLAAAAEGCARGLGPTPEEIETLVPGLRTICFELAARFCVDAFEDVYFGWDPKRFPTRREHNRVRAAGQLALGQAVDASRAEAERRVREAFR